MQKQFDPKISEEYITKKFYDSVVPSLQEYIRIPNLSRAYDPEWNTNGRLSDAANHIKKWVEELNIKGLECEIIKDQEFSPIIFTQVKGDLDETILFYGHFDKQPPFTGWDQGLGPTIPVIRDGKLYGRGGADDGYATYGSILAIKAVQQQGLKIPRCVMITQGDEQSGSGHMIHYLQKLKSRIGNPSIILCLDSGTIDYDRFWLTTSLRGNLVATLQVETLKEGVHSGDGSGVVPTTYRVLSQLLSRIQDTQTGEVNKIFAVNIPPERYIENYRLKEVKGEQSVKAYPFYENTQPVTNNLLDCILNRAWKPTLTVTGQTGLPDIQSAGNVLNPCIEVRFSLRLPPTLDHKQAIKNVQNILTTDPPYGAKVQLKNLRAARGWNSKSFDPFLQKAIDESSNLYFKNERLTIGEGGSIPVMGMFLQVWPEGQYIISGVLGPNSNAHGPNQFLHLEYTRKLICSIAHIVGSLSKRNTKK